MLREVMRHPTAYWKTSSPVLGYMGSLSIFQHLYGVGISEVCLMPRFLIRYRNAPITLEHYLYDVSSNTLYNPYSVRQTYEIVSKALGASKS